jgi:peptidoglycan/LPS O-acetylase OafA/YrhL
MDDKRANEIDLLRFVAALSVVFFHYTFRGYAADGLSVMPYPLLSPYTKYGHLGVELFFMISGFVILMTAAKRSIVPFIVSRVVRLYPAFWVCCTLTFVATLVIGGERYSATIPQFLINLTMLSGFFYVSAIDGVYWSLFVELQFYAFIALLLVARKLDDAESFLLAWLMASMLLELHPIGMLRRLLIVDHSAYFIAGAICFLIWAEGVSMRKAIALLAAWGLSIDQSVKGLPALEKYYNTHMDTYVVCGIVTIFFGIMYLISVRRTGILHRRKWLTLGAITYPLYLLHQYIAFMIFNLAYPSINAHVLLWSTLVVMITTAFLIHTFVEKPVAPILKTFVESGINTVRVRLALWRTPSPVDQPGMRMSG